MIAFYLSFIEDERNISKFETLYERYELLMYHIASQISPNRFLVEDIVQESFVRIAQHIDDIRMDNENETKAYICTITQNCAYNMVAKEKKGELFSVNIESEEQIPDPMDYEDYVIDLAFYEELINAISSLDIKYSQPLIMQAEGYGIAEIARALDLSVSAVKMRLSRAKLRIIQIMEGLQNEK
ncbi:MAG: RNA polymerase sigma factor [Ruminococcaceae bacterium]|nr:RNA polymerase sigma factor [Oscillospiraceae bacterium]